MPLGWSLGKYNLSQKENLKWIWHYYCKVENKISILNMGWKMNYLQQALAKQLKKPYIFSYYSGVC